MHASFHHEISNESARGDRIVAGFASDGEGDDRKNDGGQVTSLTSANAGSVHGWVLTFAVARRALRPEAVFRAYPPVAAMGHELDVCTPSPSSSGLHRGRLGEVSRECPATLRDRPPRALPSRHDVDVMTPAHHATSRSGPGFVTGASDG